MAGPSFGHRLDELRMPLAVDQTEERVADFLEARKTPKIRRLAALRGLHRLHGAIIALEEDAFSMRLFHERQAAPVNGRPGEFLGECKFSQPFEDGQVRDPAFLEPDFARPPATGGAALTLVEHGHGPR